MPPCLVKAEDLRTGSLPKVPFHWWRDCFPCPWLNGWKIRNRVVRREPFLARDVARITHG
jgi:hypothetical protein